MRKPKNWTLKEINYLKRNYGKTSAEKLGKKMGRSGKGIISKAFDLGLSSNYKWDRNGKNNPFWKKHHSKKSKVKMSLSKKEKTYEEIYGRKSGKDKKQNMSKSMKEKWKEKEYKNKIIRLRILSWKDNLQRRKESSIKMNKLWKNPIYRKKFLKHKIVSGMKGRHHNKKTIKKISEGNKGKIVSKETKLKISIANKGRIFSKKAKLRMSKAHKGRLKGKKNPMKKIENLRKCMLSNQIKPNLPEKQLM
jgi:enoyl reductase-like protein